MKKQMESSNSPYDPCDISAFMRALGYEWSNEAQVYYGIYRFEIISRSNALNLYLRIIGRRHFDKKLIKNWANDTKLTSE